MNTNNFLKNLYKDIFSLNSLYEIVRNIFTVIVIGIALYIFLEIYPIPSEYFLLFLLALVGVLSYFYLPIISKILMLKVMHVIKVHDVLSPRPPPPYQTTYLSHPSQPKCTLALLLDISSSMEGEKIMMLNEGIKVLKNELVMNELARKRVEIAVITFGDEVKARTTGFSSVEEFYPDKFKAGGVTPMGTAILEGISQVEARGEYYKKEGIDYYRPLILLITDGAPTDMVVGDEMWNRVVEAVHKGEEHHKFFFWPVGVEGANIEILKKIAPPNRDPLKVKGAGFREMFMWLSSSMEKIVASKLDEQVELERPEWTIGGPAIQNWTKKKGG